MKIDYRARERDDVLKRLVEIQKTFQKIQSNHGNRAVLKSPDFYRVSEGLLMNAWTAFESFIEEIFIWDVAEESKGPVGKWARKPRSKKGYYHIATRIVGGLSPQEFTAWHNLKVVKDRAKFLELRSSRFLQLTPADIKTSQEVQTFRNAIAHHSGTAKLKFLRLLKDPKFKLNSKKRKGITVGRALCTVKKNPTGGNVLFVDLIDELKRIIQLLVP